MRSEETERAEAGVLDGMHGLGRFRMSIDPRTPIVPGRSTPGLPTRRGGRTHLLLTLVF